MVAATVVRHAPSLYAVHVPDVPLGASVTMTPASHTPTGVLNWRYNAFHSTGLHTVLV